MSDSKLRELERRWKESGAVEDEVAYLLERMRVGELDQSMLDLSAHLGYPAARAAKAIDSASPIIANLDSLMQWLDGFVKWGDVVCQRVMLTLVLSKEPHLGMPIDDSYIYHLEEWILSQSDDDYYRLVELSNPDGDPAASGFVVPLTEAESIISKLKDRFQDCWHSLDPPFEPDWILTACLQEIVPWALGFRDPIRERVEARQKTETP